MAQVGWHVDAATYASNGLRNDKEFIMKVGSKNVEYLRCMGENLKSDKEFIEQLIDRCGGMALYHASETLQQDFELCLKAVKKSPNFVTRCIHQKKKEISHAAVKGNGLFLMWVSKEYRKELTLDAIRQNGQALQFAYESKDDKAIVLEAVKQDGLALRYASERLINDREILLEALKQNGAALQFVPYLLRSDRELVLEAVSQDGEALEYAELQSDREVVLTAVKQNGFALSFASYELCDDLEIVLTAVNQYPKALDLVSERLFSNEDVIEAAVKNQGDLLPPKFNNHKRLALIAVQQNGMVLKRLSYELRNDEEIISAAIQQNPNAKQFANPTKGQAFVDLALIVPIRRGIDLGREVTLEVLSLDGLLLEYCSQEFKKDKEMVLTAVKQNGLALNFADQSLRSDTQISTRIKNSSCHSSNKMDEPLNSLYSAKYPTMTNCFTWPCKPVSQQSCFFTTVEKLDKNWKNKVSYM